MAMVRSTAGDEKSKEAFFRPYTGVAKVWYRQALAKTICLSTNCRCETVPVLSPCQQGKVDKIALYIIMQPRGPLHRREGA